MSKEYDFLLTTGATPALLKQWHEEQDLKALMRYIDKLTDCDLRVYCKHYLKISPSKLSPESIKKRLAFTFLFNNEISRAGDNIATLTAYVALMTAIVVGLSCAVIALL